MHKNHTQNNLLFSTTFQTPLGAMMAISDETHLYLLEFTDNKRLNQKIKKLMHTTKAHIIPNSSKPLQSIQKELNEYFIGSLTRFTTPLTFHGTAFQKTAWHALTQIPYGHTTSYQAQSTAIGKQTAHRAVANANGANNLAIIIPCHRIIASNGTLGGYGGGIERKKWLINHEKANQIR